MNINIQGLNRSIFGGGLTYGQYGLKSTQQKMERQEERDNQVAFFEKQKENLKNIKCETVEEIAKKLEMFHSYEDEIAAVKAAYNSEQMWHIMDESRELGEKIAKEAEKMEPKTPEERREELAEEALGIEENEGLLDETLDEVAEMLDEIEEELTETTAEEMAEAMPEESAEIAAGELTETVSEELPYTISDELQNIIPEELRKSLYQPLDIRI